MRMAGDSGEKQKRAREVREEGGKMGRHGFVLADDSFLNEDGDIRHGLTT